MKPTPSSDLIACLTERRETLACAESLTGGLLCAEFVSVPGASAVVRGAIVAYASQIKAGLLAVNKELLDTRGAVNADVVEQMATGAREKLGATYGIATTGVAGPDPQDGEPVGTVYVGVATPTGVTSRLLRLNGDRTAIRNQTVSSAISLLSEIVGCDTHGEQSR